MLGVLRLEREFEEGDTTSLGESSSCHSSTSWYLRQALKDKTMVGIGFGGEGIQVEGRAFTKVHVKQFLPQWRASFQPD